MNILGLLKQKINYTKRITLNGKKVLIPCIYNITIHDVTNEEPWMEILMEKLFTGNVHTFIEIGSNLGHNLIKVKSYYPGINYIGFEPNPVCVFYLYELIRLNEFKNVIIYPFALSNYSGIGTLELFNSKNDQSASIIHNFRPNSKVIEKINISVFHFKELKIDIEPDVIIRIDVEGAELEVISGMNEFIQHHKPILICEILPVYSATNEFRIQRQNTLINILKELGYTMHRITPEGNYELMNQIEVHSEMAKTNYLFLPDKQ